MYTTTIDATGRITLRPYDDLGFTPGVVVVVYKTCIGSLIIEVSDAHAIEGTVIDAPTTDEPRPKRFAVSRRDTRSRPGLAPPDASIEHVSRQRR